MGLEYNSVKIGDTWLTDDGLETGTPWKVDIPNLPKLRMQRRTGIACLGAPQVQLFDLAGETFQMTITLLRETPYEAIISALTALDTSGSTARILISGTAGDFD